MTVMVITWESGRDDPAHHKCFRNGTYGVDDAAQKAVSREDPG